MLVVLSCVATVAAQLVDFRGNEAAATLQWKGVVVFALQRRKQSLDWPVVAQGVANLREKGEKSPYKY